MKNQDKLYEVGELVEYKGEIGIVGWNENKHMNLEKEDGYLGIELLTGPGGFVSPVHIDYVKKSSIKALVEHYKNELIKIERKFEEYRFNSKRLEELEKQNKLLVELIKTYLD